MIVSLYLLHHISTETCTTKYNEIKQNKFTGSYDDQEGCQHDNDVIFSFSEGK